MEDYYEEEIINYGSCPGIRIICGRMLIVKKKQLPRLHLQRRKLPPAQPPGTNPVLLIPAPIPQEIPRAAKVL